MDEIVCRTARLTLRKGTLDDAAFILELLNQPSFIEHIGDKEVRDLEAAQQHIRTAFLDAYQNRGYGPYIMTLHDGEAIGICGLFKRDELQHPDIGYALLDQYAGYGYITEAGRAVMEYARSELGIETLVAITGQQNRLSKKVLEKLGLRRNGQVIVGGAKADYFIT